ncbi:MAG: hypothetical protein COA36_08250 [Desulfotalea sp.]|nr:MAG: hypothetical protein COA36_08250 [Desulfotalea sp.]
MLKVISLRRSFLFLPFLALFFFVLGAHVLHPYFHNRNVIHSGYQSELLASDLYRSGGPIAALSSNDNFSCPICDFFAVCSVLKTGTVEWVVTPYHDQRPDINYHLSVIPVLNTCFYIRGPPTAVSSCENLQLFC